jgi:hypothetical protein
MALGIRWLVEVCQVEAGSSKSERLPCPPRNNSAKHLGLVIVWP